MMLVMAEASVIDANSLYEAATVGHGTAVPYQLVAAIAMLKTHSKKLWLTALWLRLWHSPRSQSVMSLGKSPFLLLMVSYSLI